MSATLVKVYLNYTDSNSSDSGNHNVFFVYNVSLLPFTTMFHTFTRLIQWILILPQSDTGWQFFTAFLDWVSYISHQKTHSHTLSGPPSSDISLHKKEIYWDILALISQPLIIYVVHTIYSTHNLAVCQPPLGG